MFGKCLFWKGTKSKMEMMYVAVNISHSSLECVCVLVLAAQSYLTLCDPLDCSLPGYIHGQRSMEFSKQEYQSGLPFPSPGIFPTQGLNPDLPHCRQILYHLSHQGSPSWNNCCQWCLIIHLHTSCVLINLYIPLYPPSTPPSIFL